MAAIEAIILGAGNRGKDVYAAWALQHAELLKIVACADHDRNRLAQLKHAHGLSDAACYADWTACVAQWAQPGRAVFICLPDALHEEAAIVCLQSGLHVMLEKPAAVNAKGVSRIDAAAKRATGIFMLGHVLRHSPFFQAAREVVRSGVLGEIVTLSWRENVSSFHFAHSYVRGNWRKTSEASPFILAKCSHDLDLIEWITGLQVKKATSFGSLLHFNKANAPTGAPLRCTQGCPVQASCPYDAERIYLKDQPPYWPASVISADQSLSARKKALENGPYGMCVYQSDNDVVDHHVGALLFNSGASGTFTAHGHSGAEGRSFRIDGTKASLRGIFASGNNSLELEHHTTRTAFEGGAQHIDIGDARGGLAAGHGGGDDGLCRAFIEAIKSGQPKDEPSPLASHRLAFALENERLKGVPVYV